MATTEEDARAGFRDAIGLNEDVPAEEPQVSEGEQPQGEQPPADDRPRDEQGRFAPAQAQDEPDVRAYLERHGGDVDKALRSAVEAQQELGRKNLEVGELRQMREQLDAIKQGMEPEFDPEEYQAYAMENPREAATLAWQQAKQSGDWRLYQQTIETWRQEDPFAASDFHSDVKLAAVQEQWQQAQAPVQQELQNRDLALAMEAAVAQYPELARDDFVQSALPLVGQHSPWFAQQVASALQNGSQQDKVGALGLLAHHVRSLLNGATSETPQQSAGNAQAPAHPLIPDKGQAHVASSAYSPSRETPSPEDKAREWFRSTVGLPQ